MKFISVALFAFIFCSLSKADTFERVEMIGAHEDGSKIAAIKSHFGPSSYAPFVELVVFEAQNQTPLFTTGYSAIQGDEATIREMKKRLISENSQALSNFGIHLRSDFLSINAFATDFNNQTLIEADIYKGGEISRYSLFFTETQETCEGSSKKPFALQFCSLDESSASCHLIKPYTGLTNFSCYADKVKFSRAVRAGDYLWFFLFLRVEPLEGLYYYSQFMHGQKL